MAPPLIPQRCSHKGAKKESMLRHLNTVNCKRSHVAAASRRMACLRHKRRMARVSAWDNEDMDDLFDEDLEGEYDLKDMGTPTNTIDIRPSRTDTTAEERYEEPDFDEEPSASDSGRKIDLWRKGQESIQLWKDKAENWKRTPNGIRWLHIKDKLYPQASVPPVGDATISYSRLLELLAQRRVKRLIILNEGRDAIVEVPVPNCANDFSIQEAIEGVSEVEPEMIYCGEALEWSMEKDRFYCPLPGDLWQDNTFLELCKANLPRKGPDGKVAKDNRLVVDQCYLELVMHQPDYYWMLSGRVLNISKPFAVLLLIQLGLTMWYRHKKRKEEAMRKEKDYFRKSLAKAFNVKRKDGETKSTGVAFDDVAGVDGLKDTISQVMEMLVSDVSFVKAGVKPPRGMLFYGPPGTGKTMLAKALAGEFNVPFFACNGAEFVEMYEGIAAERVKHIFNTARANSPSIIFIDEIDALGKRRAAFSDDPGVQEREQGLLQLLIEMDGFRPTERVLVIGATNMATDLDEALVRPGRFDRKFFIDIPSKQSRFKILEVHGKRRPLIPRKGHPEFDDDDALLLETAKRTPGFSGAALENLLNEATILTVRRGKKIADIEMIKELLEMQSIGLKQGELPESIAKQRLALFHAARAIACVLSPETTKLKFASLAIRKKNVTGLIFEELDSTDEDLKWWDILHLDQVSSDGDFSVLVRSLLPLCVGRAVEEVYHGVGSISQLSASDIAKASDLGSYLLSKSSLSPQNLINSITASSEAYAKDDFSSITKNEQLLKYLMDWAHNASISLVQVHMNAINILSNKLLEDKDISAGEIVSIIEESKCHSFPGAVSFASHKGGSGVLHFNSSTLLLKHSNEAISPLSQGISTISCSKSANVSFRGSNGSGKLSFQHESIVKNGMLSPRRAAEQEKFAQSDELNFPSEPPLPLEELVMESIS